MPRILTAAAEVSGLRYIEYMRRRVAKAEPNLPVSLMDKSKLRAFADAIGVPYPKEYSLYPTPSSLDFSVLPDRFVLKPSYASAGEGVMLLTKEEGGYFDAMTRALWAPDEILAHQTAIFEKYANLRNRETIAEYWVRCSELRTIPVDYKFLAFQGEIGLVIRIDRTEKRLKISYFDGKFSPVFDDRIRFNEKIEDRVVAHAPRGAARLLEMARRVSVAAPTPFARIDLFLDEAGPLLGEVTLTPGSFYYEAGHTLSKAEDERLGRLWESAEDRLVRAID